MNLKAGYPFWLIKSGLPYEYPKLNKSITTDVAIIGGGISGALVAHHLIAEGVNAVILEGRTIGLGSTCASTSLLQYEIDVHLTKLVELAGYQKAVRAYHLCRESISKLGRIAEELQFREFHYKPSLYYAASTRDKESLRNEWLIRKENGFDVQWLEEKDINAEFGFSAPAAILSTEGAQTNAYLLTHALLQGGLSKGLEVYDRTVVSSIRHGRKQVVLKTETGHKIKARFIVYAVGYEVNKYIDKKIVKLHSTYATVSESIPEQHHFWKENMMIWNTARPYLYVRVTSDNRIVIGGRDEPFTNPRRRDRLILKKSKQLVKDFNKLFPSIEFKPEFNWTGIFGETKDGLPFIGPYRNRQNAFFSLGFGGNGITFSLIGAEIIRDMILGRKNTDAEIFSFERI